MSNDAKERFCWCCGASMGFIERRYYERMDTCGKPSCERELRHVLEEQRQEAMREAGREWREDGWSV